MYATEMRGIHGIPRHAILVRLRAVPAVKRLHLAVPPKGEMERSSGVFEVVALFCVSVLHSEHLVFAILLPVQGNPPSVFVAPSEHHALRLAAADQKYQQRNSAKWDPHVGSSDRC
jgi:hypothetical protein